MPCVAAIKVAGFGKLVDDWRIANQVQEDFEALQEERRKGVGRAFAACGNNARRGGSPPAT